MKSTILIKNARIWPAPDQPVLEGASLLVKNGLIKRVGKARARADTVIDAGGALCMPGFIQTHIHLCQTLFRGAAEDLPLLPWLRRYIWPMEAAHDETSVAVSARLAAAEMIRSGTTAFMSMETVRHTQAAMQTVKETGLMGIVGHCLMDESSGYDPLAVDIDEALAYCDVLLDHWEEDEFLQVAVAPRFALACTASNMREAADYARDRGLMLHTHASEQADEVALVREKTGMDNIAFLHDVGLSGPDVGLAHCVHTSPGERAMLREHGTRVLHCPSANLKLGSGVAPIPEYLEAGISVSIGADGAPCNNRLDMFQEMREAGLMQQPRLGPGCLPASQIVAMATAGGAEALGWEADMGSLEPGKRANLILLRPDSLHVLPSRDPAANVVYAHLSSDVELTMVNGRILYENGNFTTIDRDKLVFDAVEQRARLEARAEVG